MNIFHFEDSKFQATNLHIFVLVGEVLEVDGSYCIFDHGLGLWPMPDSRQSPKIYNFGHDRSEILS
jgi:hypothetical protein